MQRAGIHCRYGVNRAGLLALGLILILGEAARSQSTAWDAVSGNWNTAGDWTNGVPTSSTGALILGSGAAIAGSGPSVTISSGSAAANYVEIAYGSTLTVSGGSLTAGDYYVFAYAASKFTLKSGTSLSTPEIALEDSSAYLVGDTSQVQELYIVDGGSTAYIGIDPSTGASGQAVTLQSIYGSGSIVLGAGTILTLNQSSANSAADLDQFSGVISGAGGLNLITGGSTHLQLTLSGLNTYTGATTIGTNATLFLSGSGSIAASSSVSITSGGTLDISGLSSGTTLQNLSGDTTGTLNLGANTLTDQLSASNTFGGLIEGTGGFATAGSGTLTFDQTTANTYTGATVVGSGTTLVLGTTANEIATSSAVTVNGTLDASGAAQTINNLSGAGTVSIGNTQLTVHTAGTSLFSGAIRDGGVSGGTAGKLAVVSSGTTIGSGVLVLSGTNTYTGTTSVTAATLQLGNGGTTGSIGSGAVTLATGGLAFDHAGGSIFTFGNTLTGDNNSAILQEGGTTVLDGTLSGFTGSVGVTGGTLEVDTTSSATTTVSGGILQGTGDLTGTVNVNSGGTLAAGTSSTPGLFTIGTLNLSSGSTVVLRVGTGGNDSFNVTTATLAGTLDFVLTGSTSSSANFLSTIGTLATSSGSFSNVVLSGTGNLTLTGANTFAGVLTIDSGATLTLNSSGSISSAGAVHVNGALDLGVNQTLSNLSGSGSVALGGETLTVATGAGTSNLFSGALSGTGTSNLIVNGSGTLILSGTDTYAGTTVLSGTATLQVGNGGTTGSLGGGAVTVGAGTTLAFDHAGGTTSTVANALSAATTGQLLQEGGTTLLTGVNSGFLGTANVTGGTLEVDSAFGGTGTAVKVTGGTLQGTGAITASNGVTVSNGGTLAPGTSSTPGTLTINGNLTMASTANAAFRIIGPNSDLVTVNGNAAIAGNATFYVSGVTIRPGTSVNVMQISGSETGAFNVSSVLANNLYYTSVWNPTTHYLEMEAAEGNFKTFASGGNQASVAANLNSMVSSNGTVVDPRADAVINYLNTLPGSQLGAAMNQIAPTAIASMPAVLLASSDNIGQALSARMSAVRAGSTGLSLQNLGANTDFNPDNLLVDNSDTAPIGYQPVPFDFLASTPDNRWGTFISGLGTSGHVDDAAVPGYDYYSGGFQAGIDYRLFPSVTVGLAGGYQHGQTDFNQSSTTIASDTANFQLYSTWHDQGGDWVAGDLGGAYDWFNSKRESLDGMADAKPEGTEINAMLQGGRDFTRNNWTMTPSLALLYNRTMLDGYTESGSLTPLAVDSHDLDSLRTRLGFRLANRFTVGASAIPIQPYVEAGWQHEYLDQSQAFDARFASGAGGLFSVTGRNVGSDSATFGFGVSALFTPSITAAISYFGQGNDDYLENDIEGTLRYMF